MLHILQINLHHCRLASSNLVSFLNKENIDIVLIQEPWLGSKSKICGLNLNGYDLCYHKGERVNRSCILIKSNINFLFADGLSDEDLTVLNVKIGPNDFLIASAYFPIDTEIPSQNIKEVTFKGRPLVIGCDSNAHNVIWGSKDTNERGEFLMNFILNNDLVINNRGSEPTFSNKVRSEVIDITLSSRSFSKNIGNWRVLDKDSFSDHSFISFELNMENEMVKPRRNPRNTNWEVYKERLRDFFNLPFAEPMNAEELNFEVGELTKALINAFERACPIPKRPKKQYPPWWTKDIQELVKKVRKVKNQLKRIGKDNPEANQTHDSYRDCKRQLCYMIRKAKSESWKNFCESIESSNETSRLRKILTKEKIVPSFIKRNDGTWTESAEEILGTLMDVHFPDSTSNLDTNNSPEPNLTGQELSGIIIEDKIKWALKSFDPYKSAGPDGIFPAMLQQVSEYITPRLKTLFNASLRIGHIPAMWREVEVVFIPKPGRAGHSTAKDYRPISLSSFLLKTMERLLDQHIRNRLDTDELSASQHAYMKGRSTETALHKLVGCVEKSIEAQEYTLAAFLDIEGAFNNITSDSIIKALRGINVEESIIRWIGKMLTSRAVNANIAGSSLRRSVTRGTPQGGVISPLLWLLVVDGLLKRLERNGVTVIGYADDIAILVNGKFPSILSELLERSLTTVKNWTEQCGLGVNASKTELILFSRRHKLPTFNLPKLDSTEIKLSDKVKYLGIVLDRKLSWKLNVEERRKKALIAWYSCYKCIGGKWGLKPSLTRWIYVTVIRPILCYGALVWWHATKKKSIVNRLTTVQRFACLGITGALRTTPTASMEIILHILPIDLFIEGIAYNSALRLKSLGLFRARTGKTHSNILGSLRTLNSDFMAKEISFEHMVATQIPDRELWSRDQVIREGELEVYTDGSKTEDGTGSGFYIEELNKRVSQKISDNCTIFQAEINALRIAAEALLEANIIGREVSLYVDSQAAIMALDSTVTYSKVVKECKKKIFQVSEQNSVRICWVPGHENYRGNEEADILAKAGVVESATCRRTMPPLSYFKREKQLELTKKWLSRWGSSDSYKISRAFWPTLNVRKTEGLLKFCKRDVRALIGAYTGHCLLNKHAKYLKLTDTDECRFCKDIACVEDILHLLCECTEMEGTRASTFETTLDIDRLHTLSNHDMVRFMKKIGSYDEVFVR